MTQSLRPPTPDPLNQKLLGEPCNLCFIKFSGGSRGHSVLKTTGLAVLSVFQFSHAKKPGFRTDTGTQKLQLCSQILNL